jgi:preprotein translocase subunit SecB
MQAASNLQIKHYFLTALNYSVNPDFDPEKPVHFEFSDVVTKHGKQPLNKETRKEWQVELKVDFLPPQNRNVPYSFSTSIIGLFSVGPNISEGMIENFVDINGTSVLYSTLREIIYTLTAKGPFRALLLPTLCFQEQNNHKTSAQGEI